MSTHYDTLCISPTAGQEEIRQAYKSLLLAAHPDKHGPQRSDDSASRTKISSLQEAYTVLKDPISRARYDQEVRWKQAYDDRADVFDRIHLSDMNQNDNNGDSKLWYPCRCGDIFEIEKSMLPTGEDHGSQSQQIECIVECPSCSLYLAVVYAYAQK